MTPQACKRTPIAQDVSRVIHLATMPHQGETSIKAQRRVLRIRMITGPAIYDEALSWYYKRPFTRVNIRRKLAARLRCSKKDFSDGEVDFFKMLSLLGRVRARVPSRTQRHDMEASPSGTKAEPGPSSNKRMRDTNAIRGKQLICYHKDSLNLKRNREAISFLKNSNFY